MGESRNVIAAIENAKKLLAGILKAHPDEKATVMEIMKSMATIESSLDPLLRPVQRRTGENTAYAVEAINRRRMLSEYRSVGRPLRVNESLFDGIVSVLAGTAKPMAFDEIADSVERLTGTRPVEWQMRVVLRFLLRAAPPLLKRNRSRYSPDTKNFKQAAKNWWRRSTE